MKTLLTLGYVALALVGVTMAVWLAVLGYAAWSIGLGKFALVLWGGSVMSMAFLALLGSMLSDYRRTGSFTPSLTGTTP